VADESFDDNINSLSQDAYDWFSDVLSLDSDDTGGSPPTPEPTTPPEPTPTPIPEPTTETFPGGGDLNEDGIDDNQVSTDDISLNEETGELTIPSNGGDELVVDTNENDVVINDTNGDGFVDDITITDRDGNTTKFDFDNETGDVTRTDIPREEIEGSEGEPSGNGDYIPDNRDDYDYGKRLSSPLVLDLDGDGVELTSLEDGAAYFDLDADGFAEKTGWVNPDDGLLVLDRNDNDVIDDTHELFGTSITDGFSILAELDDNNDGVINAQDSAFSALQVWRDSDQDGYSDNGELQSLEALGITSINLAATETNIIQAGNLISHVSSFTRSDDSNGEIVDAWFELDQALTRFRGEGTISEEAASLPNLRGYGTVKNLRLAASENPELLQAAQALTQLSPSDLSTLDAAFDDFLMLWTGTEQKGIPVIQAFFGVSGEPVGTGKRATSVLSRIYPNLKEELIVRFMAEAFVGELTNNLNLNISLDTFEGDFNELLKDVATASALSENGAKVWADSFPLIDRLYNFFSSHDYADVLNLPTEATYAQEVEWYVETSGYDYTLEELNGLVVGTEANDAILATDYKLHLIEAGAGDDTITTGGGTDIVHGGDGNDTITTGSGNDVVYGDGGNDIINTSLSGNKLLDGGAGNDTLSIQQDTYNADHAAQYTNEWYGGTGDDTLKGWTGTDHYHFNLGDGHDQITDAGFGSYRSGGRTRTYYASHLIDQIIFGEGILFDDLSLAREDDNLIVTFAQSPEDSITVQDWFNRNYRIEQFVFKDGTVTTDTELNQHYLAQQSTEGDDIITGWAEDDVINSGAGDDTIDAGAGNDVLMGGTGNDFMDGGFGNDTYLFELGDGQDNLSNQDSGGFDQLVFGDDVDYENLWFSRTNNDLTLTLVGTQDQVNVNNWYLGANHQLDEIEAGGHVLENTQIEILVSSMAAFGPPAAGEISLSEEDKSMVQVAISTTWMPAA
jgi:Ca2+-binding RTX toxin-like protein